MKKASLASKKFNSLLFAATLTMIVTYLMLLSDTVIVGNVVGENGIAAINIVMPIYSGANFVAGLIGMGTAYLYCRSIGEFRNERAACLFSQGVILAAASGVIMFIMMTAFQDAYLDYMNVSEQIRTEAEAYWQYEKFVVLLIPINYLMIEMVYCDGDTFINVMSNLFMVAGNIILSIFLCLKLGTMGASLGTAIGITLATLVLCLHFFRKSNTLRFRAYISLRDTMEMNRLAITDAVTYVCWSVLGIILNKLVITQFGESYLVVLTVVMGVYEFSLIFDGIGEALSPLGEVYLGEKNYDSERNILKYSLKICIMEGIAIMTILFMAAPVVPGIFDITSPEMLPECVTAVRIVAIMMPFSAVAYLMTSQFLLVRKIALASCFAVFQSFTLDAVLCILFSKMAGIKGLWIGIMASPLLSILLFSGYILWRYGKEKFPWMLDESEFPMFSRSFSMTEEEVMAMRTEAERFLRNENVEERTIKRVMLLIEECGIACMEQNEGKDIAAEYTVMVKKDQIILILRDDGKLFDLTETDVDIRSLGAYVLSSLMNQYDDDRQYLTTINFNRSILQVER